MNEVNKLKKEYNELSNQLASSEIISNIQKLQELSKKHSELEELISIYEKIEKLNITVEENEKILKTEKDKAMIELIKEEIEKIKKEKQELKNNLEDLIDPTSGTNINEIIIEIRAGVGGDEATLFAQELFRMYTRYAELKGWKIRILEESRSDLRGVKEITFEINGKGIYKKFKNESGVHRVQRIPETEKSGRLHTSSASVAVLPKAKEVDMQINPSDIKLETFRSSGPGGQNVNKVSTAVRITYLPTGLSVASQNSKSQAQNRENAMTLLRSRLLRDKRETEEKKIKSQRKKQIGSGDRSEKIRTYNFPQDRITDHRINKNWHGIQAIINGDLDRIFDELAKNL